MMKIETEGGVDSDPEITKLVEASSPKDALDKAISLLKTENPDINHMKVWAWTIEKKYH